MSKVKMETFYPMHDIRGFFISKSGLIGKVKGLGDKADLTICVNPITSRVDPYNTPKLEGVSEDEELTFGQYLLYTFYGPAHLPIKMKYPDDIPNLDNLHYQIRVTSITEDTVECDHGMESFRLLPMHGIAGQRFYINQTGAVLSIFPKSNSLEPSLVERKFMSNGIPVVTLAGQTYPVLTLLCMAFHISVPDGRYERPKNRNPLDTFLSNIDFVTAEEYQEYLDTLMGASISRANYVRARLTEETIRGICEELMKPDRPSDDIIGKKFGISETPVVNLRKGINLTPLMKSIRADYDINSTASVGKKKALTDEDAKKALYLFQWSNMTYGEIGQKFGCKTTTISDLCNGVCKPYLHINDHKLTSYFSDHDKRYKDSVVVLDSVTKLPTQNPKYM